MALIGETGGAAELGGRSNCFRGPQIFATILIQRKVKFRRKAAYPFEVGPVPGRVPEFSRRMWRLQTPSK